MMACKHCSMRDIKRGNVTWTEGEPYEHPPFHSAYIEEDHKGFWLHVEDGAEWANIPIYHCPWCGDELWGDAE